MDRLEFSLTRSHICCHGLAFSNSVLFLNVALYDSKYIIASWPSSSHCNSFSMLLINKTFLFRSFHCHILFKNNYLIRLLMCPSTYTSKLLEESSFVILENPFLILLLDPVSKSFKSSFFHQYLWIYLFKFYCDNLSWSFHPNLSSRANIYIYIYIYIYI